ncbi:MAG: glycosyltransferase family 2 protein [Alphaproteobacteria bacterium]|nr:glycosyltransferase family 2 protein [Alphaproteobacteria bacterium]MDE2073885.1 glycosyltransferase family 2 protein [Alphaproteobacteria bacterium]
MSVAPPLFSVVIPVYNRAELLRGALESVRAQSCQDFEIVVVDDGSADDPAKTAAAFADPRIRCVRQQNAGASAARNRGIDLAHGRYVAFLDSDDNFLPHHLERMARLLENTTDTAGFARMIVDRGDGRNFLKPPRGPRPGEHMANYLLCERGFVPTITLVVPREIAARVRYDETVGYGDDADFAIRLYLSGCQFVMAEEPGAIWHDVATPSRLSAASSSRSLLPWLARMRPVIPARAYYGCRGWYIAKGVAATSKAAALKLFLSALIHGAYRPALAARIFLQIFLPDTAYRRLADSTLPSSAAKTPC